MTTLYAIVPGGMKGHVRMVVGDNPVSHEIKVEFSSEENMREFLNINSFPREFYDLLFSLRVPVPFDVSSEASKLTKNIMVTHPVGGGKYPLFVVIISLNDNYHWSREQIADWLDTLPNQPKWKLMDNVT